MARKSLTCEHGITPKGKCEKCAKEWQRIYRKTYKQRKEAGELRKRDTNDQEWGEFDYNELTRKKIQKMYWSKSPITKFFLENRGKKRINTEQEHVLDYEKSGVCNIASFRGVIEKINLKDNVSSKDIPYYVRHMNEKSM